MTGIYKIENILNNKIYIGQSINIEKRWKAHKKAAFDNKATEYEYPLYRAMRKYGVDNFVFDIIEECESHILNDREKYWIKYYNSFFNGYNQTLGGDCTKREKKEKILKIFYLLENTNMTMLDISKECQISYEMVQGINTGRFWNDGRDYPIRKTRMLNKNYCIDCGVEIHKNSLRCFECNNKYKIESNKCNRPSKELLNDLIYKYTFENIAKQFNVSSNAVRKWCKTYSLPYKYSDLHPIKDVEKKLKSHMNEYVIMKNKNNEKINSFDNLADTAMYIINNNLSKTNNKNNIRTSIIKANKEQKLYLGFYWELHNKN